MQGKNINPDFSVIVCTKDRPKDLARMMDSVDRQTLLPAELILVDASETDETKKLAAAQEKDAAYPVRYISSKPGLTLQRNRGLDAASGKYLAYFDDDVVLEPECLSFFTEAFKGHPGPRVAGVTGLATNIGQRATGLDGFLKRLFFLTDMGAGRIKLSGFSEMRVGDKPGFVEVVSGCNMAFKKDILKKYRFDERLTTYAYLEDLEISQRLGKDHVFWYEPRARLLHLSTTTVNPDTRRLRRMLVRNHAYLFKKNTAKDFLHYYGFTMSILGLLLYNGLYNRDPWAVLGIVEGLLNPLEKQVRNRKRGEPCGFA